MYKRQIKNVDELCEHILTVWGSVDQRIIDTAVKQWRAHFCALLHETEVTVVSTLLLGNASRTSIR